MSVRALVLTSVATLLFAPSIARADEAAIDAPRQLHLQPLPDAIEGKAPPPPIDGRDALPRAGVTDSAWGMGGGTWLVGATADGTMTHAQPPTAATQSPAGSGAEGGLLVGYAPTSFVGVHALLGRDIDGKWSPTVTGSVRLLGGYADGYALGLVARYKTEGFTEAGGEAETGVTFGARSGRFVVDTNLVGGMGVEEGELGEFDGELKLRVGYDLGDVLRVGGEGQVRQRLAGDRLLAGARRVDALGGPQVMFRQGPIVTMVSGGATTVHVAEGVGAYGMLTVAALVLLVILPKLMASRSFLRTAAVALACVGVACSSSSSGEPGPLTYGGGAGEPALPQAGAAGDSLGGGGSTSTGAGDETGSAGSPPKTIVRQVAPADTDPAIDRWTDPHTTILRDPQRPCASAGTGFCNANGELAILLVHLAREGAKTDDSLAYLKTAAVAGYHVVSLSWPNDVDVASLCDADPDPTCWENVRLEVLDGTDHSPKVDVPSADSIDHRLVALLGWLDGMHPGEGWGSFLDQGAPKWSSIVASGHSSGAAMSAILGRRSTVKRVLLFAGPVDGKDGLAPWISATHATPAGDYFAFVHQNDPAYMRIRSAWGALGLDAFGSAVDVDMTIDPPPDAQELVTALPPATKNDADAHDAPITDATTPTDVDGAPIYVGAWNAMLHP